MTCSLCFIVQRPVFQISEYSDLALHLTEEMARSLPWDLGGFMLSGESM